jgi:hypothetical protein
MQRFFALCCWRGEGVKQRSVYKNSFQAFKKSAVNHAQQPRFEYVNCIVFAQTNRVCTSFGRSIDLDGGNKIS